MTYIIPKYNGGGINMIQPNYGVVSCAKLQKVEDKIRVECPFKDLEEVKKPISLSATAFLLSKENKGGKIAVQAKVVFTLVYLSEDGYKKSTCEIDGVGEISQEDADICAFATDVKLLTSNGLVGVCTLVFSGVARQSYTIDVLSGGDGLNVKTKEICVDRYNSIRYGKQVISDEFSLDFIVGEVLSYRACAYLTNVNCSIGRIILEGEAVLTVKALPFAENNDIVKERRVIPFRYELDDVDAMQGDKAYATVDVSATHLKVLADEGREKSTVSVDISLDFCGGCVACDNVTVVEDAFIKYNECDLKRTKIELLSYCGQKIYSDKVICDGVKLVGGGKIVSVIGEDLSVISLKQAGDKVYVDGVLKADVVLKNADNGIAVTPCECPISIDFNADGLVDCARVVLTDVSARVRNEEIELECCFKLYYNEYELQTFNCVCDVLELGQRSNLDGAISICVGKKGDDLWDVAKRLGFEEQEILKFNPEIEFPLEKDDRILVYRQKI